jgi:hypothetical protein
MFVGASEPYFVVRNSSGMGFPKRRSPRFGWASWRHWSHRSALYLEEPYTGVSAPRQAFKYPDPTTSRTKTATVEPLEVFARSFMLDQSYSELAL